VSTKGERERREENREKKEMTLNLQRAVHESHAPSAIALNSSERKC